MSTRCNIIIQDEYDKLWFYRHSDGYPTVTVPSLRKFMKWVKEGRIRNNVGQAAGWLVILGNEEYRGKSALEHYTPEDMKLYGYTPRDEPGEASTLSGWKVGAYEPTTEQHGDIRYLYTLDLCTPDVIVCDNLNGKVKKFKLTGPVKDF